MACCLMASSHYHDYLNQCWLTVKMVQWYSSEANYFTRARHLSIIVIKISLKINHVKSHSNLPGGQWVATYDEHIHTDAGARLNLAAQGRCHIHAYAVIHYFNRKYLQWVSNGDYKNPLYLDAVDRYQCTWKTFMIHQTFVRWAFNILFKYVRSLIRHLGLAIRNVWWFSWTLRYLWRMGIKRFQTRLRRVWNRFIPHESQVPIYHNQGVVDSLSHSLIYTNKGVF